MRWILLLALICFAPGATLALELQARLESSKAYVGEPVTLELRVNGASEGVKLKLPQVRDLEILQTRPPMRSSQTTIINGQRTSFSGLVFQIQILPLKAGQFTLPPIEVTTPGGSLKTQPLELWVSPPPTQGGAPRMKLLLQPDRPRYYVGEAVTLTLTWNLMTEVAQYDLRWPFLDSPLPVDAAPSSASADLVKLRLGQYEVPFERSSNPQGGEVWTTLSRSFVVYPEQAGELLVPPARVTAQVPYGHETQVDFFGRSLRRPKLVNQFVQSPSLRLAILPLPLPAPASFNGAVGQFRMQLTPQFTELQAGEPLGLQLEIQGQGRLTHLRPPSLDVWGQGWSPAPWSTSQPLAPGVAFATHITPGEPGELLLPPLEWSYFDPQKGQYVTLNTQPLRIQVKPRQLLDQAQIQDHRQTSTPLAQPTGAASFLPAEQAPPYQPWWLLWLLVPPLLWLGTWLALRLHQTSGQQPQPHFSLQRSYQTAQAKLSQGDEFYRYLEQLPLPAEPDWQTWGQLIRGRRFSPAPCDEATKAQDLAEFQRLLSSSRPHQAAP